MEHLNRYRRFWRFFRRVFSPWLKRKFNYTPEQCTAEGPMLVLCNHNTDWDPLLLGLAFPEYMSFVASEHIFRRPLAARLLGFLVSPIARLKGTTAGDTVMTMLRRLKGGVSVAMFAEGNRSFDGRTGVILPATGKLARSAGVTLVTYRLDGGYFTSPRWCGSKIRRGRMSGRVVGVYSPEELRAMTPAQVNEIIRRDLFVDAYAVQREQMIPYVGKNLAEHLETVLYLCPKCGRLGSLHSSGDMLLCDCGFSVRYTPQGFFEGADAPFDNVTDWDARQTEQLCALADAAGTEPICSDSGMRLIEITPDHGVSVIGEGSMTLYSNRLECCGTVFPLAELDGFSVRGPQTVGLSMGGHSYEIDSSAVRCTRKYMTIIEHLREAEKLQSVEKPGCSDETGRKKV